MTTYPAAHDEQHQDTGHPQPSDMVIAQKQKLVLIPVLALVFCLVAAVISIIFDRITGIPGSFGIVFIGALQAICAVFILKRLVAYRRVWAWTAAAALIGTMTSAYSLWIFPLAVCLAVAAREAITHNFDLQDTTQGVMDSFTKPRQLQLEAQQRRALS